MKMYMRVKCKRTTWGALGHYHRVLRGSDKTLIRDSITIFLPRLHYYMLGKQQKGTKYAWDDLISHTISHEYIHKLLYREIGEEATTQFDNIAGHPPKNPFEMYAGLRL